MLVKKFFFVLLFSPLLLAQINSPAEYFPLKDGMKWKSIIPGKDMEYKPNKEYVTNDYQVKKDKNQYIITKIFTIAGISSTSKVIYEIHKDGIYEVASGDNGLAVLLSSDKNANPPFTIKFHSHPYLFLKFPLKLGTKWTVNEDNGSKITKEVADIREICEIKIPNKPIIKYHDVILIKETDYPVNLSKYEYYAKGVGLIKEELPDGTLFSYLDY